MKIPETPENEKARLRALEEYQILDTPAEESFDALTRLAAHLLDVPIALVSIVDAERQWFKSRYGLEAPETPRDVSFCGHVVAAKAPLIVSDAFVDDRFADNPLVTGAPHVRFYAGMPLRTPDGFVLGTLCAISHEPRELTAKQQELLGLLAAQVVDQLERRRQRLLLQESSGRWRALFEGMIEGVIVQDQAGTIISCNPAAEQILGLSKDLLMGRTSIDPRWRSVKPDGTEFPGIEHPAMVALRTGEPLRDQKMGVQKPSGERAWISINAQPMFREGQREAYAVMITFRDVTQQEMADAALVAERSFLRSILESIPNSAVAVFDHDLRLEQRFGQTVLAGGEQLLDWAPPEQRALLEAAARRCLNGERSRAELSRDGKRFEINLVPFVDAKGLVVEGLVLAYDVSERDKLREQLARQDRLVTTGTLAAGVGHEINNPLTYIAGNIEFLLEELRASLGAAPSERQREQLEALSDARQGAEQIRKIVRGLRAFAREESAAVPTDVLSAIEISVDMAMHELRQKAAVNLELARVPMVLADESRLSQVFVNLLVNAVQAFTTNNPVRNRVTVQTSLTKDNQVLIALSDNGPGIAPEILPRIFDPFFTTKPVGQNTGLGLSISNSIITSLGGELTCETTLGEGTTFRVLLPVAPSAPTPAAPSTIASPQREGRVLLVDDDQSVLKFLRRLLQAEHEVVACADPRDALQRIEAGETFDVIFCDLMMPHLTGAELYLRVKTIRPTLAERFVFITGGALRGEMRTFLDQIPNERLNKPFNIQNLQNIARRFGKKN